MSAFEIILERNNPDYMIEDDSDFLLDTESLLGVKRNPMNYAQTPFTYGYTDSLLGKKNKEKRQARRQERRENRAERKNERRNFKLQKIETKAAGKVAVASAKGATGMEDLFSNPDAIAALSNSGGGFITGSSEVQQAPLLGISGPGAMSNISNFYNNNKRMIMIIAAIVVVVIAIVVYMKYFRKK